MTNIYPERRKCGMGVPKRRVICFKCIILSPDVRENSLRIAILFLFASFGQACLGEKKPKLLPIQLGTTSFAGADLGIGTEPPTNEKGVYIPLISDEERLAIKETLDSMNAEGQLTEASLRSASETAKRVLFEPEWTLEELAAKVNQEVYGAKYTRTKPNYSLAQVLEREGSRADEFFGAIESTLPVITDEELIGLRKQNTISLVNIRLLQDFGSTSQGVPKEVWDLVQKKTVEMRNKINAEMLKRELRL